MAGFVAHDRLDVGDFVFPECVAKVLVFVWGVWGRDRVRCDFGNDIASDRARSFCARCAVPLGLASRGVVWAEVCGAVPWGLVGRAGAVSL